tara:strand:- start:521 stop:730 length:210 start_codon:yes stop_codon:yes gene_type:complete
MTQLKYKSRNLGNSFYKPENMRKRERVMIALFCVLFGASAWYCLTTTLDDMTKRDCLAGMQQACAALEQ